MTTPAELDKLRTAFRDNPRSTVFVALAQALVGAGRPDEAVDVSRQGLSVHPDHTEGRLTLARAFASLGKWKEAEQELVKVVKLDRYHQKAFSLLGEVLIRRANYDVAVKALSRAHDLDPLDDRAKELLGKAQARQPLDPPRPPGRSDFAEEAPTVVNTRGIPAEAMPTPAPVLVIQPRGQRRDDDTDISAPSIIVESPAKPVSLPRPAPVVSMPPPPPRTVAPPVVAAAAPAHEPPVGKPHPRRRPPTAPRKRVHVTTPLPEYKPRRAPTISGRDSPDDWLNSLLGSGTPFEEKGLIIVDERGALWGHHLKRPFVWLWIGLVVIIGGSTGWYLVDKWARDTAVAAHLRTARGRLMVAGSTDLSVANDEAQQAIQRDPSSVEAVATLAAARALALLVYGDGQVQDVDTAIIASKERLRMALDKPDDKIGEREYLDQDGGRELVIAQTAFNLAVLSRGLESKANLPKARVHLDEALKRWPDDPQVVWLDGLLRLATADRGSARTAFSRVVDKFPLAGLDLGDLSLDDGDFDNARGVYSMVLEKLPGHPLALAGRAMVAAESGVKMKEALDELEPTVAHVPGKRAEAWVRLAVSFLSRRLDMPERNKQELDAAIATGNGEPRFLARVALALADQGQFEKAFITRARVRSRAADNLMPIVDGELLLASGQPDKAFEAVAEAKGPRIVEIRGRALLDMGKATEAQALFVQASAAAPGDVVPKAWLELARVTAEKQGVGGLARMAGDKAPPAVRYLLGEAHLVMGETGAAVKAFEGAMDDNPLAYRAHARVAEIRLAQASKPEHIEQAEAEARAALALAPAYVPARAVLGRALVRAGKQSEAAPELAVAVEAGRATAEDELAFAVALQARGDADGAREAVKRAAAKGASPEAIARTAELLGDPSVAHKVTAPPKPAPKKKR